MKKDNILRLHQEVDMGELEIFFPGWALFSLFFLNELRLAHNIVNSNQAKPSRAKIKDSKFSEQSFLSFQLLYMSHCPPHTMYIPESIAQYMQTTPQWSFHPRINDEIHLILINENFQGFM